MTRRALYTALLALFVGSSAAVPIQAQQTGEEDVPAAQNEPVTVRVTNDSWSDMRIYVMETATQRTPWRIGTVTAVSRARFELPHHLRADHLVLVAVAIGSRQRQFTDLLQTWPGALVHWNINNQPGLSFASVH